MIFQPYKTALTIALLALSLSACDDGIDIDAHRRGTASDYMIAVANPHAAQAGVNILANGGSAVDAAIAAEMVLTLVEPQSSGIGGGAFLVHFDAGGDGLQTYDGRETAPSYVTGKHFLDTEGKPIQWPDAAFGGRGIGVPGLVRMLGLAHAQHGVLPWSKLFEPAIRLAEDGFQVSPRLAGLLAKDTEMPGVPTSAAYFYPNGRALEAGDILKNPALAKTLRAIADIGPAAFYTGPIAAEIAVLVSKNAPNPSPMSVADINDYQAKQRPAVCAAFMRYRVCGMGPPSSGGILVAQILGILDHFEIEKMPPFSLQSVHLIAEASRLAFADRALYVADDDVVPVPTSGLVHPDYLTERARLINKKQTMPTVTPGRAGQLVWDWSSAPDALKGLSTTHMSVRDSYGNTLSMTASIERAFGAKVTTQGFLLNNQLTDFSFSPEKDGKPVANAPGPGKRPRSTMSPTLVFDETGKVVLAIGSPGGSRIAGYTVKAILGVLAWDMDIANAIAAPNVVSRGGPVEIEIGTSLEALKPKLEAMGHTVSLRTMTSGLHGIHVTENGLVGGADPRREGIVLGK
tara:strand:+ start:11151 stop:12872 length:1722 start_codon:yes stop_codon:yes gene_type:complete